MTCNQGMPSLECCLKFVDKVIKDDFSTDKEKKDYSMNVTTLFVSLVESDPNFNIHCENCYYNALGVFVLAFILKGFIVRPCELTGGKYKHAEIGGHYLMAEWGGLDAE